MLKGLLLELDLRQNEAEIIHESNKNHTATLYFGGGTPTVYTPSELNLLAEKSIELFLGGKVDEFTVEANPDDLTTPYLKALKQIGVNRLSIGIQSFINRDLVWMRRRHSAQQAIDSVKKAQDMGFNNISVDLIYGIPEMSLQEWENNIKQAIDLQVQHLSAYHLTIEPKTILGRQLEQGKINIIDDEFSAEQYKLLEKMALNAGFIHYEISNFAKAGFISKHNSSYWFQQPYIGIGPSAHSFNGYDTRRWNLANNLNYLKALSAGKLFYEEEILKISDSYNEYLLTHLRTERGVNLHEIKEQFGEKMFAHFLKQLTIFQGDERFMVKNNRYIIPSKYWLVSDSIINRLFYI